MEKIESTFFSKYKIEILSGLTVALALVPEAVAFAFVAGVHPIVGLHSAFIICLLTALFGGRPGMISGATGALAVIIVNLVNQHGIEYLFAAVVLMGIIQMAAGYLKLGKFINMVPYPVMLGFVNGLAIVIFLAQLQHFKVLESGVLKWIGPEKMIVMLVLIAFTMAIIKFLPKITNIIPSPLASILATSFIVTYFGIETRLVGDLTNIAGDLPEFHIPNVPFSLETLKIILPYSFILASVGLIESLLTLTLIDDITSTKGLRNKECKAQGLANIATGFFCGMGGCAMIGQSMINIRSGAREYVSAITASVLLIFFVVSISSLIEMVPIAALVGVMFMVVIDTFKWLSLKILHRIPKSDAFIIVIVTIVTIFTDLAVAVFVGVITAALVFAWESAKHINVDAKKDNKGTKIYKLRGPLFFGSAKRFAGLFDISKDPKNVIVDFEYSRVWDHSGIEAIDSLARKYSKAKKQLHLRNLSGDCHQLLKDGSDETGLKYSKAQNYLVAENDS